MSSPAAVGTGTRQYRCQKRQKPCDHCRERKLKCQTDTNSGLAQAAHSGGRPACQRCAKSNIPCTFIGRPRRRAAASASTGTGMMDESSVLSVEVDGSADASMAHEVQDAAMAVSSAPLPYTDPTGMPPPLDHTALNTPTSSSYRGSSSARVSTQLAQTMDAMDGHSIMLLGASSECDPWLLRHCHFDQLGLRSVHKMYFRNAGGVPTADKIPIHFLVSDERYLGHPLGFNVGGDERMQLGQLVQPAYGVRLISL